MANTSLDRWRRAHATLGIQKCVICGAPEGHRIARLLARPTLWTLDVDLWLEHPDVYRRASRVVIEKGANGICRFCATPKGRENLLHIHALRVAKEAHRAADQP